MKQTNIEKLIECLEVRIKEYENSYFDFSDSIVECVFLLNKAAELQLQSEDGWIQVSEHLPELNPKKEYESVHCGYFSDTGNFHQCIGFYAYPHKVEFGDDEYDGDFDEIEEQEGRIFLKEGWYENVEQICGQYNSYYISRIVTHWKPLTQPFIKKQNKNMTPKEKAEELINRYKNLYPHPTELYLDNEEAKQCSLIAVDEMLIHVNMVDDDAAINYWQKVKQEIENL